MPHHPDGLPTLDQQIESLAQSIQARYLELKAEADALSDQYERITGRDLSAPKVTVPAESAAATAGFALFSATTTKSGKKRLRKQGVDVDWIRGQLGKQSMTLKQLQAAAERESRSALSVMNVLNANKAKFSAATGTKKEGVKGKPPQLWSTK